MKTFVRIFMSSAIFGIVILIVYIFVAHAEAAGTVLLGMLAVALIFAMVYALVAEREANLEGDKKETSMQQWAGDDLGVYTPRSAWPLLVAVCVALGLLAMLWSPVIALLALVALILCLWRLGAESARQG